MKSIDGGMVDEDGDVDMEEEETWSKMDGVIIRAVVEQNEYGLGLSLAGQAFFSVTISKATVLTFCTQIKFYKALFPLFCMFVFTDF